MCLAIPLYRQLSLLKKNWKAIAAGIASGVLTSLVCVLVLSILLFSIVQVDGILLQMVCKLLLLPVLVGIAYEINRYVGRHDNPVTRFVTAPGLWLQNFTTNPPDDSMIQVGIASLKAVIPEKKGQDAW